jgi:hypothetical protein
MHYSHKQFLFQIFNFLSFKTKLRANKNSLQERDSFEHFFSGNISISYINYSGKYFVADFF